MEDKIKIIAMYLPQFHKVKENDEWWGEGFTDWVSAKNARPLFDGHYQPRIPQNHFYYDLMDKHTMKWQADLMHKYGIDGMCIYHYWFSDGRQILEKPAENLLAWKDIDMPFCFCWANESWARSWSNIKQKNVWASTYEPEKENESGVLLEQDYGSEAEWAEHFRYFLPFFHDNRYIRINEKPVIVIYLASEIPCLRGMVDYWRNLASENGLPGLYIIGGNCTSSMKSVLDGQLHHEPQNSIRELRAGILSDGNVCRLNYHDVWETLLRNQGTYGLQSYYEGFVGYDDTPRRGREGVAITGASPVVFEDMMVRLLQKNMKDGSELLFLNAWNEWGEGMYMEPDTVHRFEYLEAVKRAKKRISNSERIEEKSKTVPLSMYQGLQVLQNRTNINLHILEKWFRLLKQGISLGNYIKKVFPNEMAIYGYGFLGKLLYEELKDCNVSLKFVVEKNSSAVHVDLPVYRVEDNLPEVDCIIVTAQYYYDEIYISLKRKGVHNILSIEEVINSCAKQYSICL